MAAALLALTSLLLAFYIWRDRAEFAKFKALTRTEDRQRRFARWAMVSFLVFGVGGVAGLWAIGTGGAILTPPLEFAPLLSAVRNEVSDAFAIVLIGAILAGQLVATVLVARRADAPAVLGDIAALMPRNRAEYGWVTVLSINAGVSEEIFFRLLYPLIWAQLIGDALIAFVIAGAVFGLLHIYQGIVGILTTAALGAVMTLIYLATGSLLWPVVVHVLIDLRGLVLQPALMAYFRK